MVLFIVVNTTLYSIINMKVIWEDITDVELEMDEFDDLFSKAAPKPKEKKVPASS